MKMVFGSKTKLAVLVFSTATLIRMYRWPRGGGIGRVVTRERVGDRVHSEYCYDDAFDILELDRVAGAAGRRSGLLSQRPVDARQAKSCRRGQSGCLCEHRTSRAYILRVGWVSHAISHRIGSFQRVPNLIVRHGSPMRYGNSAVDPEPRSSNVDQIYRKPGKK